MRILKTSVGVVVMFSLLLGETSPVFAAALPASPLVVKADTPVAKAKPAPAPKPPKPPKVIKPPKNAKTLDVASPLAAPSANQVSPESVVPVVPSTPPVVPDQSSSAGSPNTTVIDIINTLPKLPVNGGGAAGAPQAAANNFRIVNPLLDVSYLDNGVQQYKLYQEPRYLKNVDGGLAEMPANYNYFDEFQNAKMSTVNKSKYAYQIDFPRSPLAVSSGNYDINGVSVPFYKGTMIKKEVGTSVVTTYQDFYKNINLEFTDSKQSRERKIIFTRKPEGINRGDMLTFWETYKLPAGALVKDQDGTIYKTNTVTRQKALAIVTPSGASFSISPAQIDDSTESDMSVQDLEQRVVFDNAAGTMSIGVMVSASYLLEERRIYPVTVDPIYYACDPGDLGGVQCTLGGVTDLYLRWLGDRDTVRGDLYVGYYGNDPAGPASRVIVAKFPGVTGIIPGNYNINSAVLVLTYDRLGLGNFNGSVTTVARKITTNWALNTVTYTGIRNTLLTVSPQVSLATNAPSGTEYQYNITSAFNDWNAGQPNYGVAVEPTPAWLNNNPPPWPNRLFIFRSSRSNSVPTPPGGGVAPGPYLLVTATAPALPDLVSNTFSSGRADNTFRPGETINFTHNVRNAGAGASAAAGQTRYYFHLNTDSYAAGDAIGTNNLPALGVNATTNQAISYVVPANTAPGNYRLTFWVDYSGLVSESNDFNNQYSQPITIAAPLQPDLTYTNQGLSSVSVLPGQSFTASIRVVNSGQAAAPAGGSVYYYFAQNSASYNGADRVATDTFPALAVNGVSDESATFTVPGNTPQGTYYLSMWVDSQSEVAESNENNNKVALQLTVRAGQDLSPSNVQIVNPRIVLSGEQLSVNARIQNYGNVASNNVNYRLRINEINTGAVYTLTNQSPATLNLSASYDNVVNLTGVVPGNIAMNGTYQVLVELDQGNNIGELDESNNVSPSAVTLTIQRNGYCGGCGGGAPQPPSQLGNSDQDAFADVEEKFAGTNVLGGQTLGLYDTARAPYYLTSPNDSKAKNYGADPVNTRTGVFEFNQKDFEVTGRGVPISVIRSYNSRVVDKNNRIGNGWNLSTHMYYYQDPATRNVELYLGGTLGALFMTNDNGVTFTAPPGVNETLTLDQGNFVYRTLDGTRYIFSRKLTTALGMIDSIVDTFGNTTRFTYNVVRDVPLLASITDPSGRRVDFSYGNIDTVLWDKVQTIRDAFSQVNPRVISYIYDGNGNLVEVHDSRVYNGVSEDIVRSFGYDNNNRLTTYTDPRGTILYNEYDANGRVVRQREFNPRVDAVGTNRVVYELVYQDSPDPAVPGSATCTTVKSYTDAQNFISEKSCFSGSGLKIYVRDGVGNVTTTTYDGNGMPLTITDPNGAVHQYVYDGRRRLTQETLPDTPGWNTVVTYTYENNFNHLTQKTETARSRTDANLPPIVRQTTYTIDPANGSVTRITDPLGRHEDFTYDASGNARTYTTQNGATTTYTYDGGGNYQTRKTIMVQQADGSNQTITSQFTYDLYGNKLTETMPNGAVYTYEYDTFGNQRKTTDPSGAVTTFTYDREGHKTSQTDALGHVTNYVYDTNIPESLLSTEKVGANGSLIERNQYDYIGNVVNQTDARGNVTRYVRDAAGRVTQRIEPLTTMSMVYDGNGNVTRETRGVGSVNQRIDYAYDTRNNLISVRRYNDDGTFVETLYGYDGFNNKISTTDANGGVSQSAYDLNGRLTSLTDPLGNETRYSYDAAGNKIGELAARAVADASLRNANGQTISYQYDGLNRLIKKTNALNKDSLIFYDELGHVVRAIDNQDANGGSATHVTRFEFNNRGLKIRQTDANGNATNYEYDALGTLTRQIDQLNRATNYVYDEFGRLIEERNAAGNSIRYTYDENGNKTSVTLADGSVSTSTYDAHNRLTQVTDALGGSERYAYDAVGNKTRITSKRGGVTNFIYNGLNRLVSEQNAQNTVTTYTYDRNGNRLSETTNGVTKSYQFDANNRVTRLTHPGAKTEAYAYDANGNLVSKADGNGALTRFVTDALDRTTQKQLADDTTVTYSYDNWNNVVQLVEPVGTTTYTFDAGNRLLTEQKSFAGVNGAGSTVTRTYTADNQLASLTDAANRQLTYSYTGTGLLESVLYQNQALATYAYNTNGKPTSLTYRNGIVQNYAYDSLQRPTQLTIQNAQQQVLFSHAYTYDANSNRTQTVEATAINGDTSNRTIDYTYDTVDQLSNVNYSDISGNSDLAFTYDGRGNRMSLTTPHSRMNYSYTAGSEELAQYTTNDHVTNAMTYDANGSLTRETYTRLGKPQKTVDYRWNTQNRLSQIAVTDTSRPAFLPALPVNTLDFAYDDAGSRVKKTVNATDTTYYVNNGLVVLDELNGVGAVTKTVVQGLNEQIAQIDAQGVITFTHPDTQGTTLMLSNAAGAVIQQYDYDPFGSLIGSAGTAALTPGVQSKYLYTNQEYDVESNLYYYNARYYNPVLGRFISRDLVPGNLGDTLSRNAYIYVKNNPLKYTDPTGLWFDDFLDSVSSAVSSVGSAVSNVASAVKDAVVDTAVAVKTTVVKATTAVATAVSNVQWKTVGIGLLQTGGGVLQSFFGASEVASGFAIGAAGTAGTAGIGAVPAVAAGIAVGALGANNLVAGTTQTASGLSTIWNGLTGKTEIVDMTINPAHEAINAVTEKGSTANKIATFGFDALDLVAGIGAAKYASKLAYTGVGATGDLGEAVLKDMGGQPQKYLPTPKGGRYIDQLVDGVAHESKVGYQSLTDTIRTQISKDAWLVNNGDVESAVWNFFKSPVTGKVGASQQLLNELTDKGLSYVIHDGVNLAPSILPSIYSGFGSKLIQVIDYK